MANTQTFWTGAVLKGLLIAFFALVGCRDIATGETLDPHASLVMGVGETRPFSPGIIELFLVQSGKADDNQIRMNSAWTGPEDKLFTNLAFNGRETATNRMIGGSRWSPSWFMRKDPRRLHSPTDVLANLQELKQFVLSIEPRPYGMGHIFLVPDRGDYDALRRALKRHGIEGLSPLSDISGQCAYARFSNESGNNQFSILVLYVPDRTVDLTQPADRKCMITMFARNLGLSVNQADDLVFGDKVATERHHAHLRSLTGPIIISALPATEQDWPPPPDPNAPAEIVKYELMNYPRRTGKCQIAWIELPSEPEIKDSKVDVTDGCPVPPVRRAEVLTAYIDADGVGVPSGAAQDLKTLIRERCKVQVFYENDPYFDQSCADLLKR